MAPKEVHEWEKKATISNLRHEDGHVVLRIVSDEQPSPHAVMCHAALEDLYLYYFPVKEGTGLTD